MLLNNKPIQSDVQSLLNQIPANSIKSIEIITSPSAQYDAEGKAGIINILTLKNTIEGKCIDGGQLELFVLWKMSITTH